MIKDSYIDKVSSDCIGMALANLHLRTPDNFDFKQLDNWSKRKKTRFEQFRIASGLANKEEHAAVLPRGGGRRCSHLQHYCQ